MLHIGIAYNPSIDLPTSGYNQTSILLVELFQRLNFKVSLISIKDSTDWWPDFPRFDNVTISTIFQKNDLDYFIDIDGIINSSYRKKIATNTIVFMRSFMQFNEMDRSIYPEMPYTPRYFDNILEIWCWDILNSPESIQSIQTLFSSTIRRVPFIWSKTIISHYSTDLIAQTDPNSKWTIHISEKNDNTSSSIIPLVAIRELYNKKIIDANYVCHNMERIQENKFLKENILNNIEISTLPVSFEKKVPFYEWTKMKNNILFSHSRFISLRPGLLNAIWLGIPVIHNSPIIKSIHLELEKLFYFGNEFAGICEAFSYFTSNPNEYYEALPRIRHTILVNWSISANLSKWATIMNSITKPIEPTLATNRTPIIDLKPITNQKDLTSKNEFIVAFSEMWDGFNYDSNFITDALRQQCKLNNRDIKIIGIQTNLINSDPNVHIVGPFSKDQKIFSKSVPKIYFTAENWQVPNDDSIDLYLTPYRTEDEKHIRLPTWITFIDWFNESADLSSVNTNDNPNRLPLSLALKPHPKSFSERSEFCAFVVSNPISKFRNDCFTELNSYKKVNSGGDLYNNIGGRLELKYPGGGCGDIPKYEFFSNHKFTLSFENSQADGYITEKVLHSKMAGCIPLYWGDINTNSDFVSGSIINISQLSNPEQIVKVMQKLEENPEICARIAATPILDEEKKQNALNIISKIANKILELGTFSAENLKPKMIDEIFIVNLDSRKDRWDNLISLEPYLENNATRISAVNGKTLKLNNFIYNSFKNNTFLWKKSVIGCLLSHIKIWSKIINSSGKYFLVLEDDVRFNDNWISTWNKYATHIPKDAELLYLGGVLPPNKAALPSCLEEVNKCWSQIKPNTFFSPNMVLPIFHFCTYSYIISKQGAYKLLKYLTSSDHTVNECDHFIGSPNIGLKKYVANSLLTRCFQDDDSTYINSQFNDINKTNNFDSDIWNNTECFTEEEIKTFLEQTNQTIELYYVDEQQPYALYEEKWIKDVFNSDIALKPLSDFTSPVPNNSWFIVQRPHLEKLTHYFTFLKTHNINFKVLHLSDEFSKDNLDFYTFSNCKGVIRNYCREGTNLEHVVTIPLGYHYKGDSSKMFKDRDLVWSFHGTSWFNRRQLLEQMYSLMPHHCHFTDSWNDPNQSSEGTYLGTLTSSKFCPVLRGNNVETFRLYESLESGVIPIYVRISGDELFWQTISKNLNLNEFKSWDEAIIFINHLLTNPDMAEEYRVQLIEKWNQWKLKIVSDCHTLF